MRVRDGAALEVAERREATREEVGRGLLLRQSTANDNGGVVGRHASINQCS